MTACMQQSQSGQLWTIRYERAKNQLPFLRCKSKSRVLHMIPVDSTTEAVGRPPTPPLQPDQPPTLTPFKEPAWPPWAPSARVPVKSCLKYSRGLLSISMHSRVQGPESVTSAPPSNTTTAPLSLPFGYTRPPPPTHGVFKFLYWEYLQFNQVSFQRVSSAHLRLSVRSNQLPAPHMLVTHHQTVLSQVHLSGWLCVMRTVRHHEGTKAASASQNPLSGFVQSGTHFSTEHTLSTGASSNVLLN